MAITETGEFRSEIMGHTYEAGYLVTHYRVYVPDRTRSGGYRYEYVATRQRVEHV